MKRFEELYKTLTAEQKKAVDSVEGPVMVIAGPGTGKTHILTLRIANILRETQAQPSNVLALTFTESAARTMRSRLSDIVGEETAREVFITTFHSFCEHVLSIYGEYFPEFIEKRPMSDIEQVLLMREALDRADLNQLRPPKKPYLYINDLLRLYETLVREGVSFKEYASWGEEEKEIILGSETFQYKKGSQKGELNKEGQKKVERLEKVSESIAVFEAYQKLKDDRSLYDFGDMLSIAIGGIEEFDGLRAELQEAYQYILADEHQDANAMQHKLLELLAYDDHPNIFVVGDEKQAIYRFQGADLSGFQSFTDMFPRAVVVELKESFRSYQHVLDTAHSVIEGTGKHQQLSATRSGNLPAVSLFEADDPLSELGGVSQVVSNYIKEGIRPHEIAVISRSNDTADRYARHLEAAGVPVLRAGDLSLFSRPIMHCIRATILYFADQTKVHELRTLLLAPWWNVDPARMMQLLHTHKDHELSDALQKEFPKISEILSKLGKKALSTTPIEWLSLMLSEIGARDYLLSRAEHLDDIHLLRTLLGYFEDVASGEPSASLLDVVSVIARAEEHGKTILKRSLTQAEGQVTVITAHKAKGMEFERVVIVDSTESSWERGGRPDLIPSPFTEKQNLDDAKRLFYVALTRAKDHALITYAKEQIDGRERKPSTLIPQSLEKVSIEPESLPTIHVTHDAPKVVANLVKRYVTEEGFAPSALNEYLESPPLFFARRVLRMCEPATGPTALGSAVHAGIASLIKGSSLEEAQRVASISMHRSTLKRDKVFDDLVNNARKSIEAFQNAALDLGEVKFIEETFSTKRKVDDVAVLLKGKVDAVFRRGEQLVVVDFKTGSTVSGKDENAVRQLLMYAVLLEAHDHTVSEGLLVQVTPDKVKEYPVSLTKEMKEEFLTELDVVIRELLENTWRSGDPSTYDPILKLLAS